MSWRVGGAPPVDDVYVRHLLSPHQPGGACFQVPALCQVRKGRGTHYVYGATEIKSLGCAFYCPLSGKAQAKITPPVPVTTYWRLSSS